LKTLLTEDNIEASVFERQLERIASMPGNIRLDGTRDRDHLGIDIHTGYPRIGSQSLSRKPCDDAGSAGDVQNAIPLGEAHAVQEIPCPGTKE
jgi:hypothetical protein